MVFITALLFFTHMFFFNHKIKTAITGALVILSIAAASNSISVMSSPVKTLQTSSVLCQVPLEQTNWTRPCNINQFDPSLGTLQSVTITTESYIEYEVVMEYTDTTAGNVNFSITNNSVSTLDSTQNTAFISTIFNDNTETIGFPTWDGITDFNGASGNTYNGTTLDLNENVIYPKFTNSATESITILGNEIEQFIGTSDYNFWITTIGLGGISSNSNFLGGVTTRARANVNVNFTYDPVKVPETLSSQNLIRTGGQNTLPVSTMLLILLAIIIQVLDPIKSQQ